MKGVQIKRHRNQLPMHIGHHFMPKFIPFCKTGQIIVCPLLLCMENMRAVLMDQNSMFILFIIAVSADMVPLFQYQHLFPCLCQFPCCHASGNAGSNDYTVKHHFCLSSYFSCPSTMSIYLAYAANAAGMGYFSSVSPASIKNRPFCSMSSVSSRLIA